MQPLAAPARVSHRDMCGVEAEHWCRTRKQRVVFVGCQCTKCDGELWVCGLRYDDIPRDLQLQCNEIRDNGK